MRKSIRYTVFLGLNVLGFDGEPPSHLLVNQYAAEVHARSFWGGLLVDYAAHPCVVAMNQDAVRDKLFSPQNYS